MILPTTFIVFCRVHIRRNLLIYNDARDDIIIVFDGIQKRIYRYDGFIEMLNTKLSQVNKKDDGYELLSTFLNNLGR